MHKRTGRNTNPKRNRTEKKTVCGPEQEAVVAEPAMPTVLFDAKRLKRTMKRVPKLNDSVKTMAPGTGCGRSLDALLLTLGHADLAGSLQTRYAGGIGLAALLLARKEVADLARRVDRLLTDALSRIERQPTPRPAS